MKIPFLFNLDFSITSTWTSKEKNSILIHRYGIVTIDDKSKNRLKKTNFHTRVLFKNLLIGEAEMKEIIIAAYNSKNQEIGSIFLVIENLISSHKDITPISSISASGIFDELNNVTDGKHLDKTNQVILLF